MIHAIYISIIVLLLVAFVWQRIRAGFWKRLYQQSVEFKGVIEGFRLGPIPVSYDRDWPDILEKK